MSRKETTFLQYPYPPEPSKWTHEERMYAQGLRRLFDILFSRKLNSVLIADGAVTSRHVKPKSIALSHVVDGFGQDLDISGNSTVTTLTENITQARQAAGNAQTAADAAVQAAATAQTTADAASRAAAAAQQTANGIPDLLIPVGTIIIATNMPAFGSWEQTDIGLTGITAWKRVEVSENVSD